jgi:hypothetical protein
LEGEDDMTSCTTTVRTPATRTKDFISSVTNNIPSKKCLVNCPDGRCLGVAKLDSGFNDSREALRMSEGRRRVIHGKKKAMDTTQEDPMENANKILKRHGFDENISVHGVTLQVKVDELMKATKTDECTDTTIFETDEECKAKFVDKKGSETNSVYPGKDDADGTMWVCFWLMGKSVKPENLLDAALQRDKKRSKAEREAEHDLQEMHLQFSLQMQQEQHEKAIMAKQMAQAQAQLERLLNDNSSSDTPMPDPMVSSENSDTPLLAAFVTKHLNV